MDWARLPRLLLLLPAAACGWSVRVEPPKATTGGPPRVAPAEPGASWGSVAGDPEARALYLNHCGRCHEPFLPSHAPADAWPRLVGKYGPRAQLFGKERARVVQWLKLQAG